MINYLEQTLEEECRSYDIATMRATAVGNMAFMEAAIAYEEAELEYIREDSRMDDYDLDVMFEEADDGFFTKIKKAIGRIIDAIVEFFRNIKNKIVSVFTKHEAVSSMEEAEKKIRFHPLLKHKKVQASDGEAEQKVHVRFLDKLKGFVSRISSGKEVSDTEIESSYEVFIREHQKALAVGGVMTLSALAALTVKRMKSSKNDAEKDENAVMAALHSCEKIIQKAADGDGVLKKPASALVSISQKISDTVKSKQKSRLGWITKGIQMIKALGKKGKNAKGTPEADPILSDDDSMDDTVFSARDDSEFNNARTSSEYNERARERFYDNDNYYDNYNEAFYDDDEMFLDFSF